jgi:hypothetical protein
VHPAKRKIFEEKIIRLFFEKQHIFTKKNFCDKNLPKIQIGRGICTLINQSPDTRQRRCFFRPKFRFEITQWFSNCVPRHFGVPSEIQRVPQNFFVNTKYSGLCIEIWLIFQLKAAQCYA